MRARKRPTRYVSAAKPTGDTDKMRPITECGNGPMTTTNALMSLEVACSSPGVGRTFFPFQEAAFLSGRMFSAAAQEMRTLC
jgi:hypothetical protein